MLDSILVENIILLISSGIMTFFAVFLWSRTRDISWMMIILSVIISYVGLLYELFLHLGVLGDEGFLFQGQNIVSLAFKIVPHLLFTISFALMIKRSHMFK